MKYIMACHLRHTLGEVNIIETWQPVMNATIII